MAGRTVPGRTVDIEAPPAGISRDEEGRGIFIEEARLASSLIAARIARMPHSAAKGAST